MYGNVIEATLNASSQDFMDAGLSLDILESLRLVFLLCVDFELTTLDMATKVE